MIDFVKLNEYNTSEWNNYVQKQADGEVFHLAEWSGILKKTYNYQPFYYLLRENSEIRGVLPLIHQKGFLKNNIVTPPSGLLLTDPVKHSREVYNFIVEIQNQTGSDDFILYNKYQLTNSLKVINDNVRIVKNLPLTVEGLERDIGKKRRWGVKKAIENGLHHEVLNPGKKELNIFYKIYAHNYRDLGTPVNAKKFFQNQLDELTENIRMLIVRKGDVPICVKWLILYKNTILSSESATLRGYFPLRINDYQFYHAMKFAIENGYHIYNMGRSQRYTGTFDFKKSWGDLQIEDYPVYRTILKSGISERKDKFRSVMNIWKKTPVGITNFLGPLIRKNVELD